MVYQLQTEQFSGPMEKLLELIEARELEITELNLAAITADFLDYLGTIDSAEPRLLADFVMVASRLLLIKSRALLPNLELSPEEEKGISDLEAQLKFYQAFKPVMADLKRLWERGAFSVSRPLLSGRPAVFYPSEEITIDNLKKAVSAVFEILNRLMLETKTIKSPLVSLEEKIQEIMEFFQKSSASKSAAVNFRELNREKGRAEIIVMFLALLHLLQKQIIKVEQKKTGSDIMIEKMI